MDVGCACGRVRVSGAVFGADVGADLGVTGVDVLVGRRVDVSAGCAACAGWASCFIEGLVLGDEKRPVFRSTINDVRLSSVIVVP